MRPHLLSSLSVQICAFGPRNVISSITSTSTYCESSFGFVIFFLWTLRDGERACSLLFASMYFDSVCENEPENVVLSPVAAMLITTFSCGTGATALGVGRTPVLGVAK